MARSAARTRESDHPEYRETKKISDRPPRFAFLGGVMRNRAEPCRTYLSKPALVSRRAARRVPKSLRKQSSAVESRLLCCRSFVTDGDLGRLSPNRERGDNGREPRSGDRQAATDRPHTSLPFLPSSLLSSAHVSALEEIFRPLSLKD